MRLLDVYVIVAYMKNIDFINELKLRRDPVHRTILKYLPEKEPFGHYEMIREYPYRMGKYFRPGLILLSSEMFGGKKKDALLTAAAMQLSEDWILIHDDIEDHSDERRHKPTLNKMHGEDLALNAGDALHLIMWKTLGDAVKQNGTPTGWKIFEKMNEVGMSATEGQYLEISWIRNERVYVPENEYIDMIKRKTAEYTVIGPLQPGALLAGASERDLRAIKEWGTPFGYAFQIWDDYMNIATASEKQGKENGGDILEGKRTLLLSHLLSHCTGEEKKKVVSIYLKKREKKTEKEKSYVIGLMRKYGSDEYAKLKAREYGNLAKKLFDKHTKRLPLSRAKEIIRAGIDFVTNREE